MSHIRTRKQRNTRFSEIISTNSQMLPKDMDWKKVLYLLRSIAPVIGLPIGAIDLLAIYYSSGKDKDWIAGNSCKSWVQVKTAAVWRGVNRSTIYRYNEALSDLGIIAYSDYGNRRRFGFRHEDDGTIIDESTFGVNLKPVIFRLQEFQSIAFKMDMAKKERLYLHHRISSLKSKIIKTWPEELIIDDELDRLLNTATRKDWSLERLQGIAEPLEECWNMVIEWWEKHEETPQNSKENSPDPLSNENQGVVSENALQCDAGCTTHIYKTNNKHFVNVKDGRETLETTGSSEPVSNERNMEARGDAPHASYVPPMSRQRQNGRKLEQTQPSLPFSLAEMLDVINVHCQGSAFQMMNEMPHNVSSLLRCAETAIQHLGIHHSAWIEAQRYMGAGIAAASVMIVQAKSNAGEIHSTPGGYLRGMTEAKKQNRLHITKSMRQLVREAHQTRV